MSSQDQPTRGGNQPLRPKSSRAIQGDISDTEEAFQHVLNPNETGGGESDVTMTEQQSLEVQSSGDVSVESEASIGDQDIPYTAQTIIPEEVTVDPLQPIPFTKQKNHDRVSAQLTSTGGIAITTIGKKELTDLRYSCPVIDSLEAQSSEYNVAFSEIEMVNDLAARQDIAKLMDNSFTTVGGTLARATVLSQHISDPYAQVVLRDIIEATKATHLDVDAMYSEVEALKMELAGTSQSRTEHMSSWSERIGRIEMRLKSIEEGAPGHHSHGRVSPSPGTDKFNISGSFFVPPSKHPITTAASTSGSRFSTYRDPPPVLSQSFGSTGAGPPLQRAGASGGHVSVGEKAEPPQF